MHNRPNLWLHWIKSTLLLSFLVLCAPVFAQEEDEDYGDEEGDYIVEDSAWMLTADTAAFYYEEGPQKITRDHPAHCVGNGL